MKSFLRNTPFRLSIYYALSFWLSVIILLGAVYYAADIEFQDQLRNRIYRERDLILDVYQEQGMRAVIDDIKARNIKNNNDDLFYELWQTDGQLLVGNLSQIIFAEGWSRIELPEIRDSQQEREEATDSENETMSGLILGVKLPELLLAIGTHRQRITELREILLLSLGWALGLSLILASAGGAFMSWISVRRITKLTASTQAIMAGDFSRRLPIGGFGDEIDRLAGDINKMLARIEQLMANVKQVTNDIAHDLRTPLGRLRLRLEGARKSEESVEGCRLAMDRAIAEADEILTTFNALLRIGQIEAGSVRSRFKQVDLSALVVGLVESFDAVAEDKKQHLAAHISPAIHVDGDKELLTQMLVNLIENALNHSPVGADVGIILEKSDRFARLTISDTGPGIPASMRDKVFRPFYRLEQSRGEPGNGLGLALVRAIADLHDVKIDLQDNEPGAKVIISFNFQ